MLGIGLFLSSRDAFHGNGGEEEGKGDGIVDDGNGKPVEGLLALVVSIRIRFAPSRVFGIEEVSVVSEGLVLCRAAGLPT